MNCLKQYSGLEQFQKRNTPTQNEQCLKNFDLSEYRQVLSDTAVWIFQGLTQYLEEKIQPLIVPAILEHEEVAGLSSRPTNSRRSVGNIASPPGQKPTTALLQELTSHYKVN